MRILCGTILAAAVSAAGAAMAMEGAGATRAVTLLHRAKKGPAGANPRLVARDWHRLGNLDFCGFIGGAPEFADRTHAYRSGEKIEKSLVLIWDGIGEKTVKAELTVDNVANVKMLSMPMTNDQSGMVGKLKIGNIGIGNNGNSFTIPQGERVVVPIPFAAPDVAAKTTFTMAATFAGEGIEQFADTFDFEVRPRATTTDARQSTGDTLRSTATWRRSPARTGRSLEWACR